MELPIVNHKDYFAKMYKTNREEYLAKKRERYANRTPEQIERDRERQRKIDAKRRKR